MTARLARLGRPAACAGLLWLAAGLAGCTPEKTGAAGPGPAVKKLSGLSLIPARTPEDKALGLQFVTELPADRGVIFFLAPERGGGPVVFHGENCRFVIGMAALDRNGRILKLHDLFPWTRVVFPAETAFVIETNRGWFPARGFAEGERLDMASVTAAIDESTSVRTGLERAAPAP